MDDRTQQRGSRDTPARWHVIALILSVLLHVVPFPVYLLGGMFHWFGERPSELPDHETIIPIDLMMSEGDSPGGPGPEMPKPTIATLEEAPTSIPPAVDPKDAGVEKVLDAASPDPGPDASPESDAAPDATLDAGQLLSDADIPDSLQEAAIDSKDATVADAAAVSDVVVPLLDAAVASTDPLDASSSVAGPDAAKVGGDGGRADAQPFRPIRDPVGLSGDARKIAPRDPNVSLLIYPERIRGHRLAMQFAPTLTKLKNWRNFFGGTDLDPVRDTDRILLAGPQLRDSSRVVAVVRYNVPQARVRSAIDVVVKRSRGQWENKRVPVAKAHVDGAERYFVMTGPNLLVVVPPDGLEQALKLPGNLRFPSVGNEAVVLFLKYPANAFRGMPVKLPQSVEWMRFSLSLNPKGGADARLDAKDKDAETAAKNAPELTEMINKVMVIDLIFTKRRLLDPVTFRAEGDHIRTETHVTDAQLRHILSFMAAKIEQVDREVPAPARSR